jgi:hypothetical protein
MAQAIGSNRADANEVRLNHAWLTNERGNFCQSAAGHKPSASELLKQRWPNDTAVNPQAMWLAARNQIGLDKKSGFAVK